MIFWDTEFGTHLRKITKVFFAFNRTSFYSNIQINDNKCSFNFNDESQWLSFDPKSIKKGLSNNNILNCLQPEVEILPMKVLLEEDDYVHI
jgi:hypothetical protein